MKDKAIVGNIGHFDNEIDMAGLKKIEGRASGVNIKPQYDEWIFPDGHSVLVLAEGRLLNLGLRHGPSQLRHVRLVHQPGPGADRAVGEPSGDEYGNVGLPCCPSTSTRRSPGCISTSSA